MLRIFITLSFVLFFNGLASAQKSFEYKYSPGFRMGTPKEEVIDYVIERMKIRYQTDEKLIKEMRKYVGVRLNNTKKREAFLQRMENDMREKLRSTDDWSSLSMSIYDAYRVGVEDVLGDEFSIPGIFKVWTYAAKGGSVILKFKRGKVWQISGTISLDQSFNIKTMEWDDRSRVEAMIEKHFGAYEYRSDPHKMTLCDGSYGTNEISDYYKVQGNGRRADFILSYHNHGYWIYKDEGFGIQSAQRCVIEGICLRSATLTVRDE